MGWAQRVMVFLNVATQLVLINVLWLLGTLAGGVVLGVLPASVSAARLVTALFLGSPSDALWRDFWLWWQRSWASSHRRGWPFGVVVVLSVADLWAFRVAQLNDLQTATFFLIPFLVVTALSAVAFSFFLATELRYRDTFAATWRFVLLAPLTFVGTSAAILLVLTAFMMLTWQFPLAVVLAGWVVPVALPAVMAGSSLDRRLAPGFPPDDALLTNADAERSARITSRSDQGGSVAP